MKDALLRYQRLQNFFSNLTPKGHLLFPEDKTLNLENQEEQYINLMALGGIVALLSYRQQLKYEIHPFNEQDEIDHDSPYLRNFIKRRSGRLAVLDEDKITDPDSVVFLESRDREYEHYYTPHYPLEWKELCKKSELTHVINFNSNLDTAYIEKFGKWVLEGKLPFDHIILKEAFEQVSDDLDKLAELTVKNDDYAKYLKIKNIFLQAKKESEKNTTHNGDTFRSLLYMLKIQALRNYKAGTSGFNADNCEKLAKTVLNLSQKIGANSITQSDVDDFINETKAYKQYSWNMILGIVFKFAAYATIYAYIPSYIVPILFAILLPKLMLFSLLTYPVFLVIGILAALAYSIWGKNHSIDHMEAYLFQMVNPTNTDAIAHGSSSLIPNRE